MVEIRSYVERDYDAVVRLWNDVFPNPAAWNEPGFVIRTKLTVQRELFLVAVLDGEIVGTAIGGFDGHRGWVYAVGVSPKHRRQGIGSRLMLHIEKGLVAMGCPKLNLQVRGSNADAARFYERLGYSVEDRISMGKRLTGRA